MESTKIDLEATSWIGLVKWFCTNKGYGFVAVSEHSEDILLHANVLRDFGANTAQDGSTIEFECKTTSKGTRISKVLSLAQAPIVKDSSILSVECETSGELEPVKVKWYNDADGYGFVNRFNSQEDIFIGRNVLNQCGLATLSTNEALSVRIQTSELGEKVSDIGLW